MALDVLLDERNVTKAAERVGITQSAMSHTLRRLRELFDDPLLVRARGEMVRTPRAEELAVPLRDGLVSLARALAPPVEFDPTTAERTFALASPDLFDLLVLPTLLARLNRTAPRVDVAVRPMPANTADALLTGALDLAVVPVRVDDGPTRLAPPSAPELMQRTLLKEGHRVFVRRGHPALDARGRLSRKRYVGLAHILVSPTGTGQGIVDEALAGEGLSRRIALRVPSFASAAEIVADSDLVLTAPAALGRVRAYATRLVSCATPIAIPEHALTMVWHPRFGEEPAHRWLRATLVDVVGRRPIRP